MINVEYSPRDRLSQIGEFISSIIRSISSLDSIATHYQLNCKNIVRVKLGISAANLGYFLHPLAPYFSFVAPNGVQERSMLPLNRVFSVVVA
jgi:hypothetical protein